MTKKNKVFMFTTMLLTSVVVSAVTFTGAVWYMKNHNDFNLGGIFNNFTFQDEAQPEHPSFHSLDKLVLSVKGQRQTHFVMLELALKTSQPEQIQVIDNYMPVIRNSLLKLFSNKTYEQLQNQPTIDVLQEEVKQTLLNAFADTQLSHAIDDVLLTKYVVQ